MEYGATAAVTACFMSVLMALGAFAIIDGGILPAVGIWGALPTMAVGGT